MVFFIFKIQDSWENYDCMWFCFCEQTKLCGGTLQLNMVSSMGVFTVDISCALFGHRTGRAGGALVGTEWDWALGHPALWLSNEAVNHTSGCVFIRKYYRI